MELDGHLPADIDYNDYVLHAVTMLRDLGVK
jgi:hypothetical protein